ncbi:DNA-binding CsgD family transcriptional regulator [Kribbella sp. VKM Ac-2571]|uniref:helix-turn-helix transcriptional regulator n=1 Tax=Kribbella sp. VKM Ac-2571 TaxID=2512222 RepID=UPI0010CE3407|nr:helix-turn-helix transcriptional regulator [Kribbella sp. VKM Ac-2571]TDO68557.1 DNA-binding CsgD family transcriptional regulator [Kribbella sp. VKM Ac-2571]
MGADSLQHAADKITRLCAEPRDLVSLWQQSTEVLASAVPHFWAPCFYTLDPVSLLMTSHFQAGLEEFPQEWLASEYYEVDVNKIADVARSPTGISTLYDATDGNPSSSPRWHRNMSMGGDQELVARLRTRSGEVWGAVGLYRAPDEPRFTEPEKSFIQTIAPALAEGARCALLLGQAREPEFADSPGLLILDDHWELESATPGVDRWLSELPDGDPDTGRLPSSVLTLAGRVLHLAENPARTTDIPVSRVLSRTGRWMVLHGACLTSTGDRRIAIIVEPANPSRLYPLLMSAYGLTEREKDITKLVLQGASTSEIAAELVVSAHTVQQHLKSIFDKTGVHSRRDLVGKVFFAHYEPRFRDNERRALHDQPLRGEPWRS